MVTNAIDMAKIYTSKPLATSKMLPKKRDNPFFAELFQSIDHPEKRKICL